MKLGTDTAARMPTFGEVIDRLEHAEASATGAYNHALALHESLGALARQEQAHHEENRRQFASLRRMVERRIESVPEIVAEEITGHHNRAELAEYRSLKGWLRRHAWKIAAGALGALHGARWLHLFGLQ